MFGAFTLKLGFSLLLFTGPVYIKLLSGYLSQEEKPLVTGLALLGSFGLVMTLSVLLRTHAIFIENKVKSRVKQSLCTAIYAKVLKTGTMPEGIVVNLMQIDARKVYEVFLYINRVICTPLEICIAAVLIYIEVGVAALVGVGCIALVMVLNYFVGKWIKVCNQTLMKIKDQRISLSKQVFTEIRVIKACAWEKYFKQKILAIREREILQFRRLWVLWTATMLILWAFPIITNVVIFVFYTAVLGHTLTVEKAFVTVSALFLLRMPFRELPFNITKLIQAAVSVRRIQEFLDTPELTDLPKSDKISFTQAGFNLDSIPLLNNISFELNPGEFLAIIGPVGSGKTSVLNAIMGELSLTSGTVKTNISLSYAPSIDS